ncbi:ABC transporter substrate-binding protein [Curtobacterium herbarum]|uniref:Sugar ABC transporter substrate-binding protein n=1 Tax=Curtobacterium herbarum TaxID=150122 RepID=A0ABP4JZX3_9MICO|nr:extracellular solute-binding protein [Curtobacterium herbarum]MBM7476320.1 multiple sugar transport system substrate-binding protein [Curtobacterium herbarum]MCS6544113.1 extracellular solute-binding protein [Curtobacterium herbarum]
MKTRTLIGSVVVVALATLSLQGCAIVNGSGDDPNTLRVMMGADTTYPDQRKQWQRDTAAEFKRTTGADIQWETYSSGQEELTAIQTSVISGQGPDVYAIGTTFTPTAYATGAFVRMGKEQWDAIGGKDQFDPASFGISGPSASKQIGIPFASRPFVMAVNTDLLAQAGITEMPTTWDQLTADAKATTTGDRHGMAIAYADGFDPWKFIWGMSENAGNTIVDGSKAELDADAVQRAYRTYFDWVTKDGVVDKAAIGWNNAQALAQFTDGKAAFFPMTTTTAINSFKDTKVDGKYAFALLPTVPPGATERPTDGIEAASILSGDNFVVADYGTKQDLSFRFIKQLSTKKAQLEYYDLFGNLPTNVDAAAQLAAENPQLKPIIDAGRLSKPTAFTGAWSDIQLALVDVVVQSIPSLKRGEVTDDQLRKRLQDAQRDAQATLDRQKNGGL